MMALNQNVRLESNMKMILFLILIAFMGHNARAYIDHHNVTINTSTSKEASRPHLNPEVKWRWDPETLCFLERAVWHEGGTYWCQIPDTNGLIYWQELPYTWHHNLRNVIIIFIVTCVICTFGLFLLSLTGWR